MEHFLNDSNDHNSSFFQPPIQDEEYDDEMPQSPSTSAIETTSPTKTDGKPDESVATINRPRANLNIDEEANIKLQVLVSNFSDEQLDRYEMYRRSAFPKATMKRLITAITGTVPSSNVVIALAGIAKVFVGEIVEEALELQREEHNNESKSTPLEPKHLREACRRLNNNRHHCPQRKTWRSKRKSRF